MTAQQVTSKKDMISVLKMNGYTLDKHRGKGSHTVYTNGVRCISLGTCNYNRMIFKRLIKEYNLVVE